MPNDKSTGNGPAAKGTAAGVKASQKASKANAAKPSLGNEYPPLDEFRKYGN